MPPQDSMVFSSACVTPASLALAGVALDVYIKAIELIPNTQHGAQLSDKASGTFPRKPVAAALGACFISFCLKYKSICPIFTWVTQRWRLWDVPLKERMASVSSGTSTLLDISILLNHIHYFLCPCGTWKYQCLDTSFRDSQESFLLGSWKPEG